MSSIIIKGMEMPKRCFECPCLGEMFGYFVCLITTKDLRAEHGINISRPEWCPLIELPPHGRLIDATFEENHYASMLLNPTPDVTEQDKHKARIVIDALHMAKTVIEAEGET